MGCYLWLVGAGDRTGGEPGSLQSFKLSFGTQAARRLVKEVLNKLDWYRREGGPKVALAGHFLKEVGKKNHNVGEHAALWNRMLQDGHTVQLERVRFHAGKSPWVGTRNVFKHIYKFL